MKSLLTILKVLAIIFIVVSSKDLHIREREREIIKTILFRSSKGFTPKEEVLVVVAKPELVPKWAWELVLVVVLEVVAVLKVVPELACRWELAWVVVLVLVAKEVVDPEVVKHRLLFFGYNPS